MAAEAAGKKFDIPPDVDAKELAAFAAQNVPTGETLKPHPELNILYNQITSQLKALAYEKTIGKLMGVIAPIGGTMDNLIKWKPSETLAKMGQGFLGKLNKFKGDEAAVSSQGEAAVSSQGEAAVSSQMEKGSSKNWQREC